MLSRTLASREATANLTAVGDPKQRIMAWAGAQDNILEIFQKDFGAVRRRLQSNFRSVLTPGRDAACNSHGT